MLQAAGVGAALVGSIATAAAETVPLEGFDEVRVCACDCVNQYELRLARPDRAGIACRGLREDGEWVAVRPSPYAPAGLSRFLFHTKDRYTRFACEVSPRL